MPETQLTEEQYAAELNMRKEYLRANGVADSIIDQIVLIETANDFMQSVRNNGQPVFKAELPETAGNPIASDPLPADANGYERFKANDAESWRILTEPMHPVNFIRANGAAAARPLLLFDNEGHARLF